ncbi:RNA methyltransferase [Pelagirhabdus alkalitolerans]|uniref:TrmH family RNA methyltransferase n=1 Tax=Pelagirhabdus alkalitolerans TaxID=1612202 RepID=UPI003182E623
MKNETIKNWSKLKKKKYREKMQQFIIEGDHLIEEAISSGWEIDAIVAVENKTFDHSDNSLKVVRVTEPVMLHLSETKSPQGILAIVKMKAFNITTQKRLLLLDEIQDPGNLGTMIRTADAAGFDAVLLGRGTVDVYNDKTIRSTQGSLFHLPILPVDLLEEIPRLKAEGVNILVSTLERAKTIDQVNPTDKMGLVVGNEGNGVSDAILELADERIHIPIYGQAESLNVSVAAGIMMYALQMK